MLCRFGVFARRKLLSPGDAHGVRYLRALPRGRRLEALFLSALCLSASQRDHSAEWIAYMREPCTLIIFLIKIQFFCFVNRIIFINFASGSLYLFKPAFPLEIINHIYIVKPTANQSLRMMMTRRYDIGRTPFVREDITNTPPHSLITYISVIYIDSIGSRQSCRERCCIYLPSDGEA